MKNIFYIFLSIVLLASCKKPSNDELVINSFTPHARGGQSITISGNGFSSEPNGNIVKVNGVSAIVTNASNSSLTVVVPSKSGSGPITINVGSQTAASAANFVYDWTASVSTFAGSVTGYADGNGLNTKLPFQVD